MKKLAILLTLVCALAVGAAAGTKQQEKAQQQLSAQFTWVPGNQRSDEMVTGIRQTYTFYEDGSIRLGHSGKKPDAYTWAPRKNGIRISYINPTWTFIWGVDALYGGNGRKGDSHKSARLEPVSDRDWKTMRRMWKKRLEAQKKARARKDEKTAQRQNKASKSLERAARRNEDAKIRDKNDRPQRTRQNYRPQPGAPIQIYNVTVRNHGNTLRYPMLQPKRTSGIFVEVTATVQNVASKPLMPTGWRLRTRRGRIYTARPFLSGLHSDRMQMDIQPGVKTRINAIFELPKNARPAAVGIQAGITGPRTWCRLR